MRKAARSALTVAAIAPVVVVAGQKPAQAQYLCQNVYTGSDGDGRGSASIAGSAGYTDTWSHYHNGACTDANAGWWVFAGNYTYSASGYCNEGSLSATDGFVQQATFCPYPTYSENYHKISLSGTGHLVGPWYSS